MTLTPTCPDAAALLAHCQALYPLDRTLCSDGTDRALEYIRDVMPPSAGFWIQRYEPGSPAWDWRVPARWRCHEARLTDDAGQVWADYAVSPLHVLSYSAPINAEMGWDELEPHLTIGPEHLPDALPWAYRFHEPRRWGFTVSHAAYQRADRGARYHALIRSELLTGPQDGLAVGVADVRTEDTRGDMILVCANVCHPYQVNDSITGVAAAIEIARHLTVDPLPPGSRVVRFLFCPETFGSICYLAHLMGERSAPIVAAICSEMLGTPGPLVLQMERAGMQGRLTRMAQKALDADDRQRVSEGEQPYRTVPFRDPSTARNDELVFESLGTPAVAITRFPYPEYHSSADTPSILRSGPFTSAVMALERLVRIAATDFLPIPTYTGIPCLSRHGLWADWREDAALNAAQEAMLLMVDGRHTVFDIAEAVHLDYGTVRLWFTKLEAAGLVVGR